jgi:hypothetical protein
LSSPIASPHNSLIINKCTEEYDTGPSSILLTGAPSANDDEKSRIFPIYENSKHKTNIIERKIHIARTKKIFIRAVERLMRQNNFATHNGFAPYRIPISNNDIKTNSDTSKAINRILFDTHSPTEIKINFAAVANKQIPDNCDAAFKIISNQFGYNFTQFVISCLFKNGLDSIKKLSSNDKLNIFKYCIVFRDFLIDRQNKNNNSNEYNNFLFYREINKILCGIPYDVKRIDYNHHNTKINRIKLFSSDDYQKRHHLWISSVKICYIKYLQIDSKINSLIYIEDKEQQLIDVYNMILCDLNSLNIEFSKLVDIFSERLSNKINKHSNNIEHDAHGQNHSQSP